jgi:AraC-like DNA-binding protein
MNATGDRGEDKGHSFWARFERMWSLELGVKARFSSARLARLCGVSERHLRREFQAHLFYSVKEWLEERRLDAAAMKLRSGMSLKEVAFELGFRHSSQLCREFKKQFGMTPGEFLCSGLRGGVENGRKCQ